MLRFITTLVAIKPAIQEKISVSLTRNLYYVESDDKKLDCQTTTVSVLLLSQRQRVHISINKKIDYNFRVTQVASSLVLLRKSIIISDLPTKPFIRKRKIFIHLSKPLIQCFFHSCVISKRSKNLHKQIGRQMLNIRYINFHKIHKPSVKINPLLTELIFYGLFINFQEMKTCMSLQRQLESITDGFPYVEQKMYRLYQQKGS